MKIIPVLLAGSLALNGILAAMQMRESRVTTLSKSKPISRPVAATGFNLQAIYDPDPAAFLVKLRSAGIPERVRRALIEAELDDQFREREKALLPPRPAVGWWQWQETRLPLKTNLALLDLQREKTRLRVQLLGPDPAVIAADIADNPIAPEKREMLKLITEDYRAMLAALQVTPALPIEREQIRLLEEQRKQDLAALLTPEELAAYDARTWKNLSWVQSQIRAFDATDDEFEVIKKTREETMRIMAQTGRRTSDDERAEEDRIRASIGAERFEAYDRSKRPEFQELQLLLDRSGMSRDLAVPVYELRKAIEPESHRIGADKTLSQEQGRAALQQLGERTRAAILERLGPEVGPAYLKRAKWISPVERGEMITFTPGGGGWSSQPFGWPTP